MDKKRKLVTSAAAGINLTQYSDNLKPINFQLSALAGATLRNINFSE